MADPVPGHTQFKDMLSIPYITPTGTVAIKFRQVADQPGPKYNQPSGQRTHLYNVPALHLKSDFILIVEGELDTVAAHVAGLPAVGVAGAQNWRPHFPLLFEGFSRVYVVTDNDSKADGSNPGQDLAKRIMQDLPQAINILLPAGMDVNEYVLSKGGDSLRALIGVQ